MYAFSKKNKLYKQLKKLNQRHNSINNVLRKRFLISIFDYF